MKKAILAALAFATGTVSLSAITSNILWYGVDSSYNSSISTLAAGAGTFDPNSDGSLDWNLTFWNLGDPLPIFSNFDALIIGSSNQGFFGNFNPARLLGAQTEIEAARGNRTFLSGQDADWHYINGPGAVDNGPRGFLINAVNWAASGTGLGIVALADGYSGQPNGWMTEVGSFLRDELLGSVGYFQDENVIIPAATQSFPINEGLTTGGLSNWGTSSHSGFNKAALTGAGNPYLSINDAGSRADFAVTIVTESQAGGGTTGGGPTGVPDTGATALLLAGALFALIGIRRRLR